MGTFPLVSSSDTIRIVQDPALTGPVNMGRDEALLTRVGDGVSAPTFRLYQWDPPTISLGYFQHFADFETLPQPAGNLDVVRRQTGGGAILHDLELTYSLTLPLDHALLAKGPNHLYELAHDAVIACFDELGLISTRCGVTDDSGAAKGPFFCFARRHCYDVLLGDDKLAGSAQRRTKTAVLQHGSIILGNRYAQQPTAEVHVEYEVTVERLRQALPLELVAKTGQAFEPGDWLPDELASAEAFVAKYAGAEWTRRT